MFLFTLMELFLWAFDYFGLLFLPIFEQVEKFRRRVGENLSLRIHTFGARGAETGQTLWDQLGQIEREREAEFALTSSNELDLLPSCFADENSELTLRVRHLHWLSGGDPLARQLNWLDFDLSLVVEEPCFVGSERETGHEWKPLLADQQTSHMSGCASECLSGPAKTKGSKCWRKIKSAGEHTKWLLVSRCQRCVRKLAPQNRAATQAGGVAGFLLVRLLPDVDQLAELNKRSELLFNQLQKHGDQLSKLFWLLSLLLERAQLLQAGAAQLMPRSSQIVPTKSRDSNGISELANEADLRLWLNLIGREFCGQEAKLLDRYSLVVIICAYLESQTGRQIDRQMGASDEPGQFEAHLRAFLDTFKWSGERCETELVWEHEILVAQERDFTFKITQRASKRDAPLLSLSGHSTSSPTLQSRLERVWPEVSRLFWKARVVVEEQCTSGRAKEARGQSLLEKLVAGAEEFARAGQRDESEEWEQNHARFIAQVEREQSEAERNKCKEGAGHLDDSPTLEGSHTKGRRLVGSLVDTASRPLIRTRFLRSLLPSTRSATKRLVEHLLLLLVLLIARNLLIQYLEDLQQDLRHKSREDFVKLKHMMFADVDFDRLMSDEIDHSSARVKSRATSRFTSASAEPLEDPLLSEKGAPQVSEKREEGDSKTGEAGRADESAVVGRADATVDEEEDEEEEGGEDEEEVAKASSMMKQMLSTFMGKAFFEGQLNQSDLREVLDDPTIEPGMRFLLSQFLTTSSGDSGKATNIGGEKEAPAARSGETDSDEEDEDEDEEEDFVDSEL